MKKIANNIFLSVVSLSCVLSFCSSTYAATVTVQGNDVAGDISVFASGATITTNAVSLGRENYTVTGLDSGETFSAQAVANAGFGFTRWTVVPPITGVILTDPIIDIPISGAIFANNYAVSAVYTPQAASDVVVVPVPTDPGGEFLIQIVNTTQGTVANHPANGSLGGVEGDIFTITARPQLGSQWAFVEFTGATFASTNAAVSPLGGTYVFTFTGTQEVFRAVFASPLSDRDNDLISDANEVRFGLDPDDIADGAEDPDMDGLENRQEINGYIPQRIDRAGFGPFTSHPFILDTDGDGMGDGWEGYYGMDPRSVVGVNGPFANNETNSPPELITGDRVWSPNTGMPTSLFHNRREYETFVQANGGESIDVNNFPEVIEELSTDPFLIDSDFDSLPDGYEVTFGLLPVGQGAGQGDNGRAGNPDGDFNFVFVANNLRSGRESNAFQNHEEYGRYRDTFLAGTGLIGATNPTDADSDNDGMEDGWESDMSYASGFPSPSPLSDGGPDGALGNPDGDFDYDPFGGGCANTTGFTNIDEYQRYNSGGRSDYTTHPNFIDIDGDLLPDHWETLFELDPWNVDSNGNGTDDGSENPDGDFMADLDTIPGNGNEHVNVLLTLGYDPRIAYGASYDEVYNHGGTLNIPVLNNRPFTNFEEFLGNSLITAIYDCRRDGTNPLTNDTDGDTIWDGWEWYVGMNPVSAPDGTMDFDVDGLQNFEEFSNWTLDNLADPTWLNKVWPTDPFNPDTDFDQLSDSAEMAFITGTAGGFNGHCYPGGGLNPTSCDTDGDHIPDAYEWVFSNTNDYTNPNGMEGTVQDADLAQGANDYDGDLLENYQEYFTAATYHWQAGDFVQEFIPGGGLADYDPADFFDGVPQYWDRHRFSDVEELEAVAAIPFTYILANGPGFASTSPLDNDSDMDQMDDFYEAYHGLNPLYGAIDIHTQSFIGGNPIASGSIFEIRTWPFVAGHPFLDIDQDGLDNAEESFEFNLLGGVNDVYLHTDPSPHWVTDMSYQLSWPNLYYQWNTFPFYFELGGINFPIEWPTYIYSFEANEGFDTDNDGFGDKEEALGTVLPGATDPIDSEDPINFRFMYLDGDAAMRTKGAYSVDTNALESFTAEIWVRPTNPASGQTQVILERPVSLPAGNTLCTNEVVQLNFRIGIRPDGTPFAEYSGSACDPFFVNAVAGPELKLVPDVWTHMATTYNAQDNLFALYINGNLAVAVPSLVRPANGFIKPFIAGVAPVIVGAREKSPSATVSGTPVIGGIWFGLEPDNPELDQFFEGWVDEIRVWNADIGQAKIQGNMFREFNRDTAIAETFGTDGLLFHYNFNDVPDPDHNPVSPNGFDALTGRPADGSYPNVRWWGNAPDRSTVYNDYNYVVWAENVASHLPTDPPADTGVTNVNPNTSNPYNYAYFTGVNILEELHPELPTITVRSIANINNDNDLLPLRNAEADEDIVGWNLFDPISTDTDDDGLPDEWEETFGLDPLVPTGEDGPDGDPDNDGLNNITEFFAGTNPRSRDTDGDTINDGDEDADGDGLTNLQEQDIFFTYANDPDSDDDGFSDGDEVDPNVSSGGRVFTSPVDSRSPLKQKSLVADGTPYVIPHTDVFNGPDRFRMENWSVETWIRPATAGETGSILRRTTNTDQLTFDLRLDANVPSIGFTTPSGQLVQAGGVSTIPANIWTHLAGVFDSTNRTLRLYVNGLSATGQSTLKSPALGDLQGETVLCDGISGNVDEVRIFQNARNPLAISLGMFTFGGGQAPPSPFIVSIDRKDFVPPVGYDAAVRNLPEGISQHVIAQLNNPLTPQSRQALTAAGIGIKNYVNSRTFIVNASIDQLEDPSVKPIVRWAGMLSAEDKISDSIEGGFYSAAQKLVRFYPGVTEEQANAAVLAAGATVIQDKYFDNGYLVVQAVDDGIVTQLAEKDVVGYVMGSAPMINSGQAQSVCPGLSVNGIQSAPFGVVGEGWDGPGLGRADLTWSFPDPVGNNGTMRQHDIFQENLDRWSAVAALGFTETDVVGLPESIDVTYAPVDGPFGILAFAYFPNDINPEPIAGDMNYDSAENWPDDTLFSGTTLHELGHSLGLDHSDVPDAIMFPFLNGTTELTQDDIDGIRSIYGDAAPVFDDDLVAHYPFDDGQNETHLNLLTNTIEQRGAEDFQRRGNWNFALRPMVCTEAEAIKIPDVIDSDLDGLPDWWEELFFSDLSNTGLENFDSDGLINIYEYLSDTDPRTFDSDNDGVIDDLEDRDMDGLENVAEQSHGSDPGLVDTDDDGLADNTEIINGFEPIDSRSPVVRRILSLPGDALSYVEFPMQPRFALNTWTIEANVNPTALGASGTIIERQVGPGVYNYFLRVTPTGTIIAGFTSNAQGGDVVVATTNTLSVGIWTHVSASFDPSIDSLWVELNGEEVARLTTGSVSPLSGLGPVRTTAGTGFAGFMDNVSIYDLYPGVRTADVVAAPPSEGAPNLVSLLLFDDSFNQGGTSGNPNIDWGEIEDFAATSYRDWERCWQNAATLNGGGYINGGNTGGGATIVPDPSVTLTVTPADCPITEQISFLPLAWTTFGILVNGTTTSTDTNKIWRCSIDEVYVGNFSLKAGGVLDNGTQGGQSQLLSNESAVLQTQVIGPGQVCFAYKTETEELINAPSPDQADYFGFFVDGVQQLANDLGNNFGIEGSNDWTEVCINVGAGVHTLQWRYDRDDELKRYRDSVWMDEMTYSSTSPDSDGDGLPDSYEADSVIGFGTDPNKADTDGDGMSDGTEVVLGTNPLVPETQVAMRSMGFKPSSGQVYVDWPSQPGVTYQVQKSYDGMVTWGNAPTGVGADEKSQVTASTVGTIRYCDLASPEPGLPVYRVLIIR